MLFERVFIGLYDTDPACFGTVGFFDVMEKPPKNGRPTKLLSFAKLIDEITRTYDARNSPVFEWADAEPETMTSPPVEPGEDDEAG